MDITERPYQVYGIVQLDAGVPGELLYVGGSGEIDRRIREHRSGVNKLGYYKQNPALYDYLAELGEDGWYVRTLEWCKDERHLGEREKCYLHNYKPRFNRRFNSSYSHTKESKEKISEAAKGRPGSNGFKGKVHTEESKRKMSKSTSGELHPLYRKKHTEETKQKISETKKGTKQTQEFKERRRGTGNPFYGRKHTEESKRKMKESIRKRKEQQDATA